MIRKIFLPEFFNNKRVYAQKILAFAIDDQGVSCAKVIAGPSENILENLLYESLDSQKNKKDHSKSVSNAIKSIVSSVGKFDQVYISVPTHLVIFKELELPFKDEDKIRMVLDYEIESKLPFSVEESVVDFIITRQEEGRKDSRVLVAAIRNKDLENILHLYKMAGINPTKVTVDLFSVYGLYHQISEYNNIKNASAIIDLGVDFTVIAFLQDGKLRLTRVIPKGISDITEAISKTSGLDVGKVRDTIDRFGFQITGAQVYDKALEENLMNFFQDIQFTLNSFSLKVSLQQPISKIFFTGRYSKANGLTTFCKKLLQINCEAFSCEKLFSQDSFKNKIKRTAINWSDYVVALGTALVCPALINFDFRRKAFALSDKDLVKKQISTLAFIVFFIFFYIFSYGYFQIKRLSSVVKSIEKTEVEKLKEIFPKEFKLPAKISFVGLIRRAEDYIERELEIWGPFEKNHLEPLVILQELTKIIDKRRFNVMIESVSITEENEKAKVEVQGFFKSRTGSDHFAYFEELEKRFEESSKLVVDGIYPKAKGIEGISFTVRFGLVEDEKVNL